MMKLRLAAREKQHQRPFRLWKNGELVDVKNSEVSFFEKILPKESLIDKSRVFAVDTESAFKEGELVTDLIPIAFPDESIVLDEAESTDRIVVRFLRAVLDRYGVDAERPSRTKQRRRRKRWTPETEPTPGDERDLRARKPRSMDGDERDERDLRARKPRSKEGKRDGRRLEVPMTLSVWFNLPYDVGRLFPTLPEIQAIYAGVDAWTMHLDHGLSIEWLRYIDKSAPQFHWMIRDEDRKLVVNLYAVDLTGYWKCSLDAASKSLGGEGKDDIEALVPGVHERPFDSFSTFEKDSRKAYAVRDVGETAYVYHRTVEELCRVDARVLSAKGLIPPSAPAAAARIMFARAFDAHPDLDKWLKPPPWVDQTGADAYYAGRAFGARPGFYPSGGFRILDLKSAYPTVMCLVPDPVTAKYKKIDPTLRRFEVERYKGRFGVLIVSGESLDDRYPPFRTHDADTGRLRYVAGPFTQESVTIPEVVVGVLRGSLRIDRVHGGVLVEGENDTSFLRRTVFELYALKEREGKSALGKLAKLLMNSTYGKLIEVVMKELRSHVLTPVPGFTESVQEIAYSMVRLDVEPAAPADELFFSTDEDQQKALEARYAARLDPGVVAYAETLATVVPFEGGVALRDFVRRARSYSTGRYFLPIYASQITGLVSAELGAMAAEVGALCGDTDSVHFMCGGDPLEDEGVARYFRMMDRSGYLAPRIGKDLTPGCTIGRWESDSVATSTESVIVRPKVYSHKFVLPDGTVEYKQAFHGFSRYSTPEAEAARRDVTLSVEERNAAARLLRQEGIHEDMKRLVRGEKVSYTTRPAPVRGRTAAVTHDTVGLFVTRRIEVVNPPVFAAAVDPLTGWVRWMKEAELESRDLVA